MVINGREFKELVSTDEIRQIVIGLVSRVEKDFEEKNPYFLIMMNGAFIFASDFVRNLKGSVSVGCVKYTSYVGMRSSGKITAVLPIPENVKDRDVILLEDLVDTGRTMEYFLEEIKKYQPKSVSIVSLFLKPDVFKNRFPIQYVGKEIPDHFVVGYGLDFDGQGRNLPALFYTE